MAGNFDRKRMGSRDISAPFTRASHIDRSESLIEGRYRPLRKLGKGILGDVFLVHDLMTGVDVALKELNGEYRDNLFAAKQLSVEMAALKKVSHPSIVRFIEENSCPWNHFFTMEFIDGATLSQADRSFLRALRNSLSISLSVLEALSVLHGAGIVHRDLKPGNVMLVGAEACVEVKLFDFSTAYVPGEHDCACRQIVGTVEYVAPEYIKLDAKADPRSDLYSWGVSMHEMIGGSRPFYSQDIKEIFDMHMNIVPSPLHLTYPHIPPAVSAIVSRALEKDPAKRFQSALEMKDAIERCMGSIGV